MKLNDWAKLQGITYKTAHRWFQAGIIPDPVRQLPTGTILVDVENITKVENRTALYARVSSSGPKVDLDRQTARLMSFALENKLTIVGSVQEIGSGLNGHRKKLLKLLADKSINTIVIEHRERLARFGFDYIEAALAATGRKLVVIDSTEMKDDLVQDMIDVLTSFCARLYGRRSAKNKAKKAIESIHEQG